MGDYKHHKGDKHGRFSYEVDGKQLAGMYYTMTGPERMIIDHTEVDESLKGQGIGKKLLEQLVTYVRQNHIKVIPLCPFAKATLDKMPEWQDILN